jgi:hypothetical protein
MSFTGIEVAVSHVCHRWRNVVVNAPLLWSNIQVASPAELETYLKRSAHCLLDIRLDFSGAIWDPEEIFFSMLIAHVHRWRHFYIYTDDAWTNHHILERLAPLKDIAAPCLESLTVSLYTIDQVITLSVSDIFTKGAPRLSNLRLNAGLFPLPPLINVTTLHLGYRWLTDNYRLENVLAYMTSLDILSLDTQWMPDILGSFTEINLPSVRTLRIVGDSECFVWLLSFLSGPCVETLVLRKFTMNFGTTDLPTVNGTEKLPMVRSLALIDSRMVTKSNFVRLNKMFPTVTHLTIQNGISPTLPTVTGFSSPPSDVALPNLHSVTLDCTKKHAERWLDIMAMVSAQPSVKILRLTADLMSRLDLQNLRTVFLVEELKVDGPRISITGAMDMAETEFEEDMAWIK